MKSVPRIAFVIDALTVLGGGEKVLFTALEAFPEADVFTLVYDPRVFSSSPLANRRVGRSFLDRLPFARSHHRRFLPLMPAAVARLDLRGYDLVVSFTYAVAHGARGRNGARHLSYTYTPMRYAWTGLNIDGTRAGKSLLLEQYMRLFRKWDRRAAARVDGIAAISAAIAERIQHAYNREAPVIYPPVEVGRFLASRQREDFYITVSRLVPHKRIDILVEAFSELKLPLIIVGEGPELRPLQRIASPNVRLVGYQTDRVVDDLLERARGFVCAAEEDFGIAIVEAQAAGCPVLAYGRGGALETVQENVTGLFFREQSAACLIERVEAFDCRVSSFLTDELVQNARRFSRARFLEEFGKFVLEAA